MHVKGTILLISPYWREQHRWMVSSYKLAELWQRLGYRVVVACMGEETRTENVSSTLTVHFRKDIFLPDPWNYGIAFGFSGFVRRLVAQEKPDHIVINKLLFWTSLCAVPLTLRGHNVIQLTDALVGMTWWPRRMVPKICAAVYAWTVGWLILLCAQRVVFFHPQPEKLIHRLGIRKKTQVIPTGIDVGGYKLREERVTGYEKRELRVTRYEKGELHATDNKEHATNSQPGTHNPELTTRNPQPATRNPQPGTRNPQPTTHNP